MTIREFTRPLGNRFRYDWRFRRRVYLALLFAVLLSLGTVVMVKIYPSGRPDLDPNDITPKDLKVTDITDTGFTVSWWTGKETLGYLKYGDTKSTLINAAMGPETKMSSYHEVEVKGLEPRTPYYYYVVSDSEAFGKAGQPLQVATRASQEVAATAD